MIEQLKGDTKYIHMDYFGEIPTNEQMKGKQIMDNRIPKTLEEEVLKELYSYKDTVEVQKAQIDALNAEIESTRSYAEDNARQQDRELDALHRRINELESLLARMLEHSNVNDLGDQADKSLKVEIAFTDPVASEVRSEFASLVKKGVAKIV